jgi:tRNA(Ile2) C34 agmatinyltransferase TiaS
MGTSYEFICPACGYRTEVTGGVDFGFRAVLVTVLCEECGEIFDAEADQEAMKFAAGDRDAAKLTGLRCPKSKRHTIKPWTDPVCPRCGGTMERGDLICEWD